MPEPAEPHCRVVNVVFKAFRYERAGRYLPVLPQMATHLHCSPGQLPPPSYQLLITICSSILRLVAENRHHGHYQHHCSGLAVTEVDTLQ